MSIQKCSYLNGVKNSLIDNKAIKLKKNQIILGLNRISTSWEYDTHVKFAFIVLDNDNGKLILKITNKHIKSGLGKGSYYGKESNKTVGTSIKPNKRLINSILSENKYSNKSFNKNEWYTSLNDEYVNINDVYNNKIVLRCLKIKKLKENIK